MRIAAMLMIAWLACANGPAMAEDVPPVSMPNTEVRSLHSDIMDYDFGLYVTLPRGYADNPDRTYPAVYMIDGHQYYAFTEQPYNSLTWGNMVKEHMTVAVAYTPEGGNLRRQHFQTKERAADFIRFFREELIPYIERTYRTTKTDRTFYGHSLGGQFTLYMLLTATDTFENYIASAPSVNDDVLAAEEKYAATHDDMPVKLYLTTGADDHLSIKGRRFVAQFEKRDYPGLTFDYRFVEGANHGTIQATAYTEGLRLVLDSAATLPAAAYERLAGRYSDGEHTYTISYAGGNHLDFDGVPESDGVPMTEWRKLYARTETEFFPKGWPGEFNFGGEPGKPAQTFSFEHDERTVTATRLPAN